MSQEHHCLFNFGQADTGMDAVEMFDSRMILQLSDASSKKSFPQGNPRKGCRQRRQAAEDPDVLVVGEPGGSVGKADQGGQGDGKGAHDAGSKEQEDSGRRAQQPDDQKLFGRRHG